MQGNYFDENPVLAYKKDSDSIILMGKKWRYSPYSFEGTGDCNHISGTESDTENYRSRKCLSGKISEHNGVIQWKQMYEDSQKLINELGINIDVHKMLRNEPG